MLRDPRTAPVPPNSLGTRRAYRCVCQRAIYFRNDQCLGCQTPLGFEPRTQALLALRALDEGGRFARLGGPDAATGAAPGATLRRCANHASAAGCNWLVDAQEATPWCVSCRLDRTIPDLGVPGNAERWQRIEAAKRRLVSQLLALGLPVRSRLTEDPAHGLMFDLLTQQPGAPRVVTGHLNGLITLDVAEADDAAREALRTALHEPYRTLLGNLRHEVGHYYWDRLVAGSAHLAAFRTLFGDERQPYDLALQNHYQNGPPPDWAQRHVTAYASSHPWEDWAETWAHYLHMVDTVDTAQSHGLDASDVTVVATPFSAADLWQPGAPDAPAFLAFLNNWQVLTRVLNDLSRAMGQVDFYPFVLPGPAVAKLQLVHAVVTGGGETAER